MPGPNITLSEPVDQIVFDEYPALAGFSGWNDADPRQPQHRLRVRFQQFGGI
jgi:hypothetical protein